MQSYKLLNQNNIYVIETCTNLFTLKLKHGNPSVQGKFRNTLLVKTKSYSYLGFASHKFKSCRGPHWAQGKCSSRVRGSCP